MAKPIKFEFGSVVINLKYSHGVLWPSPFSRLLASTLCDYVPRLVPTLSRALDVGSGSGIQAIVLAKVGLCEVYAVDIDPRCVSATEFNALLNDASEWRADPVAIYAHLGDLFDPIVDLRFDLIVSNPPTLPASEETPPFATGGAYPQEFLDKLISGAARLLNPGGRLIVVLSSLAGIGRTYRQMEEHGLSHRILRQETAPFREFYYRHMAYYRRSQLQGVADFTEKENGELEETLYVVEAAVLETATSEGLRERASNPPT